MWTVEVVPRAEAKRSTLRQVPHVGGCALLTSAKKRLGKRRRPDLDARSRIVSPNR